MCNLPNNELMNWDQKERLMLTGDSSKEAVGVRLKAARQVAGISQVELGNAIGKVTSAVNNMEKARSFASIDVMRYFYREHRIDFNYFIAGLYSQLPADVQDDLLAALQDLTETSDPKHD